MYLKSTQECCSLVVIVFIFIANQVCRGEYSCKVRIAAYRTAAAVHTDIAAYTAAAAHTAAATIILLLLVHGDQIIYKLNHPCKGPLVIVLDKTAVKLREHQCQPYTILGLC